MNNRHTKLAFKQIVRLEWLNRTLNLVVAGLTEKEIRNDLNGYISTQMQGGGEGAERNKSTYGMSISILSCWFREDEELNPLRLALIERAKNIDQSKWLPLHMAMICAAYPYFSLVCNQVGKLFNLQDQISSGQVYNRMKDLLGDRSTIARNTRYAIRTLVSWGLLQDDKQNKKKGMYNKGPTFEITDKKTIALLLEGVLLSTADERSEINALQRNDCLYCFSFEPMTAGMLSSLSASRIESISYGLSTEIVQVKIFSRLN